VAQAIVFCRLRDLTQRGRPQTAMVCPTGALYWDTQTMPEKPYDHNQIELKWL
jgi:hypothetical protein